MDSAQKTACGGAWKFRPGTTRPAQPIQEEQIRSELCPTGAEAGLGRVSSSHLTVAMLDSIPVNNYFCSKISAAPLMQ